MVGASAGVADPGAQGGRQFVVLGDVAAVLADEFAQGLAVAHALQSAGEHGQVDVAAGLVPGAETPLGHIGPDVFFGASLEGVFPVVNGTGSIGGQVGDPACLQHAAHRRSQAVLDQVGSVGQHHSGASLTGNAYLFGNALKTVRQRSRIGGRSVRVDENFVDGELTLSVRQGFEGDATMINLFVGHGGPH